MIEPTESESKAELDRFCDALIAIRDEIARDRDRAWPTATTTRSSTRRTRRERVVADAWPHAYSRERAAFPVPWVREHKFWPAVGRVDNAYGDRNLVCCVPADRGVRDGGCGDGLSPAASRRSAVRGQPGANGRRESP